MTLASVSRATQRVVQLLQANRAAYAAIVGTGADRIGAFPFDDEIKDAILEADGIIVTNAYFLSKTLRQRFMTVSSNLTDGTALPEHIGMHGKVEFSQNGSTAWTTASKGRKDDIVNAVAMGSYVNASSDAFDGFYCFADDGYVYTTAPFLRVYLPQYTRTTALQVLDAHEPAVIAGAMATLYKDGSNAMHEYYKQIFTDMQTAILKGASILPETSEYQ